MAVSPIDLPWLKAVHAKRPLQLASPDGRARMLLDGSPVAFVNELIRLAEIGQQVEEKARARAHLRLVH